MASTRTPSVDRTRRSRYVPLGWSLATVIEAVGVAMPSAAEAAWPAWVRDTEARAASAVRNAAECTAALRMGMARVRARGGCMGQLLPVWSARWPIEVARASRQWELGTV